MNSGLRFKYYVAVIDGDNRLSYVTRINNSSHVFHCEKGKPAKAFTKTQADDLMTCMVFNMYTAAVIKVPDTYTLMNPEGDNDVEG